MKRMMNESAIRIIIMILVIGLGCYFFYYTNKFSNIEKIALLNIPNSAKLIEKRISSTDFDGSEEAFFIIELNGKEYNNLLQQCKDQYYKMPPIPNLDSYMGKYAKANDKLIYKLRNVMPPDYDLVILNMSQKILIVKHVKFYNN